MGALTLELVTAVVHRMAGAPGPDARVEAVLDVIRRAIDAELALLLLADAECSTLRVVGLGLPAGVDAALGRDLEVSAVDDPLLAPVLHGDLTPRTAQSAFGADWADSPRRQGCLRVCGIDQVATLPLSAGDDIVVAMFGRRGADFNRDDLERLRAVRDVVSDFVALTGVSLPAGPTTGPRLTVRETQVLALLARGYTCSRIARSTGSSPRTVEVHLGHIYAKLGVRDRLSAVLAAYDLALIPPRAPEGARGS